MARYMSCTRYFTIRLVIAILWQSSAFEQEVLEVWHGLASLHPFLSYPVTYIHCSITYTMHVYTKATHGFDSFGRVQTSST
jgi:hypothetical protein